MSDESQPDNRTREQLLDELEAASVLPRVLSDMQSRMSFVQLASCPACQMAYDLCEDGHPCLHVVLCTQHEQAVRFTGRGGGH